MDNDYWVSLLHVASKHTFSLIYHRLPRLAIPAILVSYLRRNRLWIRTDSPSWTIG